MKTKAIIVDLDGTLCNTDHRQHLVKAKKWNEFYDALNDDKPHNWCVEIIESIQTTHNYQIIFVSGRPEKYRNKTMIWFMQNNLAVEPFKLFMRSNGDFRKDCDVKLEIYKQDIEPHFDIQFCIDDRKQVVDMWRSIGLTCLQCAEGDF